MTGTRVAVLGAGIQGCCAAIALAADGCHVDLYDREAEPVMRASLWNEGKLHLGYVYANDASRRTARAMIEGSLAFEGFFERYLGVRFDDIACSSEFVYGVHRDSMLPVERIEQHFAEVDDRLEAMFDTSSADAIGGTPPSYFGERTTLPRSHRVPVGDAFDAAYVVAAFRTPERSIDTHAVARILRDAVLGSSRITFHPFADVTRLGRRADDALVVTIGGDEHAVASQVVNCTWEGRPALDATLGHAPETPTLHRYKLAVHVRGLDAPPVPSATLVLGPFGDIVDFGNGSLYLSWYPACKIGESKEATPPDFEATLTAEHERDIANETLRALAEIVPAARSLSLDAGTVDVAGGYILAPGQTDIDRLRSRLHRRSESGIRSDRGYHSIDTGKYGLAPLHAEKLVERIRAHA